MFDDTPLVMVEDAATLAEVAKRLEGAPVIGVDTESDSFYSYQEKVCLLQISDLANDYIIDPLKIDDLSALGPIMTSRDTVKIFHGADYDIVCLRRDFGWEIREIFDTMIVSQLLSLPKVGLADLIGRFFGHEIDKKYQRHDWSQRPLLDEHIEYARGDTHWLPALREILIRKLVKAGRLGHVEEECLLLESRKWTQREFDPDGYLDIKLSAKLDDTAKRVLRRLYLYRDGQARELDRPTFKVIGDSDLLRVAKSRPVDQDALDKLFPGKTAMKRRHARALVTAVLEGLEDDFEIPERVKKVAERTGPPARLRGRNAERAFEALKEWRNDLCRRKPNLSPVAVIANGILKEIARVRPTTIEELAEIPDVRKWQVADFGTILLEVLDEHAPWPAVDESDGSSRRRGRRRRS